MPKEGFDEEMNVDSPEFARDMDQDLDAGPHVLVDSLEEQLNIAITERDSYKDKWMRALAEGENQRKRLLKERQEAEIYGGSKLARDLLSVYDAINRALDMIDENMRAENASFVEGIELMKRDLVQTLQKHNVAEIMPNVGDPFDPNYHQAMFEAPVPDTTGGAIIQVLNAGFMIGERLLRPAQVGVSSQK